MRKSLLSILTIWGGVSYQSINAQTDPNILPTSGNVGIGTATPISKLEVMGTVHIDSTLKVSDSLSVTGNTKLGQNLKVEGNLDLTNLPSYETATGVLQPLFKGENGAVYKGELSMTKAAAIECKTDVNGDLLNMPIWFSNVATASLYTGYCSISKVGIGRDLPRVALDILGTTSTSKIALGLADPLTMTGSFHLKVNNTPQKLMLVENATRKLLQLDNTGLLRVREIILDQLVWADYVFKPNYKLLSLYEVENFIQKNGHLPNVPSAKEIATDGLNVAEMQRIMMEKIEELTLHQIELKKIIDAQAKEITLLKTK